MFPCRPTLTRAPPASASSHGRASSPFIPNRTRASAIDGLPPPSSLRFRPSTAPISIPSKTLSSAQSDLRREKLHLFPVRATSAPPRIPAPEQIWPPINPPPSSTPSSPSPPPSRLHRTGRPPPLHSTPMVASPSAAITATNSPLPSDPLHRASSPRPRPGHRSREHLHHHLRARCHHHELRPHPSSPVIGAARRPIRDGLMSGQQPESLVPSYRINSSSNAEGGITEGAIVGSDSFA